MIGLETPQRFFELLHGNLAIASVVTHLQIGKQEGRGSREVEEEYSDSHLCRPHGRGTNTLAPTNFLAQTIDRLKELTRFCGKK
jgi:hypothetical protein